MLALLSTLALNFAFAPRDSVLRCDSVYVKHNIQADTKEGIKGASAEIPVRGNRKSSDPITVDVPTTTPYGAGYRVEYQKNGMLVLSVTMHLDATAVSVMRNKAHLEINEPVHTEFMLPNWTREETITMQVDCALMPVRPK